MNYKSFPFFIFRTPYFPFSNLDDRLSNEDILLKTLTTSPHILEAIYIASPVLYNELQKLIKGGIADKTESERILLSVERYISRMSTRCTPFGLFAGCGIGEIGDKTNIIPTQPIGRTTRLDMHYLSSLYNTLIKIPEIKNSIKYYPNTSLYKIGRRFRYVETLYINSRRKYQISEAEYSSYINRILKVAQEGSDIKALATVLIDNEITEEDAVKFVNDLIDSQIIVPELNNSVTGEDLFARIIIFLEKLNYCNKTLLSRLKNIKSLLEKLDIGDNPIDIYKEIINLIKELEVPYEEKYLFQVDMLNKSISATIGSEIIDELKSTLTFLNKITPSIRNESLSQFQQDFYNRYEEREVPLLEVLDPEMGIGYPSRNGNSVPSSLVDDFILPQQMQGGSSVYNRFQSILFRKTILCPDQNKKEIELTDQDFEGFQANWDDLPPTICAMIEIIQADSQNTLIKFNSCGGSSGANLLGRFVHLDKKTNQFVRNITEKEQELMPEVILAEIVHTPEARVGNILSRPHLRNYEILYISDSDLPKEKIILLSDLMLSVKQGKLVLRSKKLNKEIIPRLTTAHNYHYGSMPIYRFLCDMQVQTGRSGLYFNWGQQLEKELSFLPRVRYKNTILSPATWIASINEMKHLFSINKETELLESVIKWRNSRFIPRYVLMPDSDNELFVDWENPLSICSLFSIIKKRQQVKFIEFMFTSENAIVKGPNGSYTNQCIIVFHKDKRDK